MFIFDEINTTPPVSWWSFEGKVQLGHGLLDTWTELLSILFSWSAHVKWELGTKIAPVGWIFWTMIFYNLKNSSQDLSNEGPNFILSLLEVGHWFAQTLLFFDKLQILASYNNLRIGQDSEFAKFWPRALTM